MIVMATVVQNAEARPGFTPPGLLNDFDGDLVPDVTDNCSEVPNGPREARGSHARDQIDTDGDGFGNICDCDFDQDGYVLGTDIVELFEFFDTDSELHDLDADGIVFLSDLEICTSQFNGQPGPGALAE